MSYRQLHFSSIHVKIKKKKRVFPGGPVVGLYAFTAEGMSLAPGRGTKIPRSCQVAEKRKEKRNR